MEYVDLFLIHNPAGLKLIGKQRKILITNNLFKRHFTLFLLDQNNLFSKSENGQVQLERTDHALIWKVSVKQTTSMIVLKIKGKFGAFHGRA